ncbi:outer membrane beta-barrel protein [Flavobacterium daemonense]|uniref:outer membrane beta-barrel protein n=1 Tax=Flavobacterium daemonense TaxID=1393049 RepID=UPI0011847EB6|nr:outer membrane beta-barrel protein [Flavobacterium daemonense]KAF2330236.1 porin family protein [Flavobacterium daemonense]
MKKIILGAIAVMTFGFANAQEQTAKGKWLIEANTAFGAQTGNTAFSLSSSDGETDWNVGAEGGYFVANNLAVKLGLGYGDNGHSNIFSYKVGAKYYLLNKFPLEASYTGVSIKDVDHNPSFVGLQGGYAWFVAKNVSVEPGVRYNITTNDDYAKSFFQFNVGFALHF